MSRRRLLATASAAGVGIAGAQLFGDSVRQLSFGNAPGGNVVVVLSLRGGSDGLSLVVPRGADNDRLMAARPDLGIPQGRLIGGDARFGLHPALAPLLPMWQAGTFGAVHAVGLPAPNRSHFSAMEEVEDADPQSSKRTGWINRVVGLTRAQPHDAIQLGDNLLPTSMIGPAPALSAYSLSNFEFPSLGRGDAQTLASVKRMWSGQKGPMGRAVRLAVDATQKLKPVVNADLPLAAYPTGPLQKVLASTATLIKADIGTRMVTIDYGDWDMHSGQGSVDGGWMSEHTGHLASSLAAFFADLGTVSSRVTVVTISEFGRRVEQNGSGTDHGHGNAMLLLGAGVKGGQVAGKWPGLASLNDGDLNIAQDYRSVLWEVTARRFPELSGGRAKVFPGFNPEKIGIMA